MNRIQSKDHNKGTYEIHKVSLPYTDRKYTSIWIPYLLLVNHTKRKFCQV